jgi:hypothetical protein
MPDHKGLAWKADMAKNTQQTGMIGVYLVAAELSHRGFIVSPTSRNARGADLLVTDQGCRTAWSVQVKTNGNADGKVRSTWQLNENARDFDSKSHVYVFVSLRDNERPEYMVVPSSVVANNIMGTGKRRYFNKGAAAVSGEGWELFDGSRKRIMAKQAE